MSIFRTVELSKLPSLKGYPEQILPTLNAVRDSQDLPFPQNRRRVREILEQELPKVRSELLRRGSRAKLDNLIYAQAIPTCQRLSLITPDKKNPRLLHYGRTLVVAKTEEEFRKRLATGVCAFDLKHAHIIGSLEDAQKAPGDSISYQALINSLRKNGVEAMPSEGSTRLDDLLQYYEFCRLVVVKNDTVYLNESRVNEAKEVSEPAVEDRKFFEVLYRKYRRMVRENRGSPYVPIIPHLREHVCTRLKIGETTFRAKLLGLTEIRGKRVVLSPPMRVKPKHEVISNGRANYYFISIYGGRT